MLSETPRTVISGISADGFRMAKRLGQNFLADGSVVSAIVDALGAGPSDTVIEIGPGAGVLTGPVGRTCGRLIAIELDDRLIPILEDRFPDRERIQILHADVLKTDIKSLADEPLILGNLPYYITTPILMKLTEDEVDLKRAVIMVQKEVAEKLTASPGSGKYGALAAILQRYFDISEVVEVPPEAFIPRPKVTSTVVKLEPVAAEGPDRRSYAALIKKAFSQRRKTLGNSLAGYRGLGKQEIAGVLMAVGIDPGQRPETLSPQQYTALCGKINELNTNKEETK